MRHRSLHLLTPVILSLLVTATGRASLPSEGLIGHWRFDAMAEGRVADRSTLGNPMLVDQAGVHAEVGSARSLECDGFETGARLEERTPLQFAEGVTLAVWVLPVRSRGYELLIGRPNPNPSWTSPVTGIYLSDARPVFGLFASGKKLLLEGPELPLRTWSLVVATGNGREAALWVNGHKVAETAQPLPVPPASGQPWYFGRSQTQYFRGRLGEFMVWNRGLAAAEVAAVFGETEPRYAATGAAAGVALARARDRTVEVESPGSRVNGTWRSRPTRTLAGLDGFTPGPPPATDRWGGRTDLPARRATGFFRTEEIDQRWWLITPDGHRYWNVGVNSVRPARSTPPSGLATFAAKATRELRAQGFNGLGNGGISALQAAPDALPWTIRLSVIASFAREHKQTYATSGHTGFTEQCFPVFHPDFPAWARREAAALAATVDDRSVIGIFTDNELQCPVDLLDRHLRLPADDSYLGHGRTAALAWLAARGRSAEPATLTAKDRYQFIAHVFETYGRIVHEAVRAVDRHHLILGPRFNVHRGQFDNPWFWPAVGKWIDVAAVNYYALWGPQREEIQAWSDAMRRPVMLTEWYSKAQDAPRLANTNGAGWLVRTQADRARYYQHFALGAYEAPALVGFHYFKYMDDDADSVALDSAGGANKGLYRPDGSPWSELLDAAGAVNRQLYPLIDFFDARAAASPATKVSQNHPHRFLIGDTLSQKLLIIERDGSVSWEYPQAGSVYDGAQLPNGNVLYCWFVGGKVKPQAGVREVTPDKQVVFEYAVARECHSVQRLPDGLTLISDPTNQRLIEVDRQGKIVRELKLQVGHDQVHSITRQCRKLPNGNYLVAQELDQAVVEYAPDGRVLHRFPVDGRVFGVSRLPNGHTLIGAGGGPDIGKRALELDPQGKTVWSFEPADFPPGTNLDWVLGVQRLPNGNTVIANFLGHGKNGSGISLLEVTPDKRVVWTFREKRIVLLTQILDP